VAEDRLAGRLIISLWIRSGWIKHYGCIKHYKP